MKWIFCLFKDRNAEIELDVCTALPFAPSIAVGTELLGEGKGPAGAGVGLGAQTRLSRRCSRCVCQQAKGVRVENFPNLCTKPPCGFLN